MAAYDNSAATDAPATEAPVTDAPVTDAPDDDMAVSPADGSAVDAPPDRSEGGQDSAGAVAAFFDLDNTLLQGSSIFYIARGLMARRLFSAQQLRDFALRQFRWASSNSENLNDVADIFADVQRLVRGQQVSDVVALGEEIYRERMADKTWPGTVGFLNNHLQAANPVYLVTAAGQELADVFARELGLTGALGTRSEVRDGVYTGRLLGRPMHGPAKAEAISELAEREGIDLSRSFAYSDSFNDLPMLSLIGHPVVINPDDKLAAHARANDWPIYDYRGMRLAGRTLGLLSTVATASTKQAVSVASGLTSTFLSGIRAGGDLIDRLPR